MNNSKIQICLLLFSALLIFLISSDNYFVPRKKYAEIITNKEMRLTQTRRSSFYNYRIETGIDTYIVPWQAYYTVQNNDTVYLLKSKVTGAPLSIFYKDKGLLVGYNISYIGRFFGRIFYIFISVAVLLTFAFFDRDWNLQLRRNWIVFLLLSTVVITLLHLQLL